MNKTISCKKRPTKNQYSSASRKKTQDKANKSLSYRLAAMNKKLVKHCSLMTTKTSFASSNFRLKSSTPKRDDRVNYINEPILMIYFNENNCFANGVFPNGLRTSDMLPLEKDSNMRTQFPCLYRPNAYIRVFSKNFQTNRRDLKGF